MMFSNCLIWSEESFTLTQILERFPLPQLVQFRTQPSEAGLRDERDSSTSQHNIVNDDVTIAGQFCDCVLEVTPQPDEIECFRNNIGVSTESANTETNIKLNNIVQDYLNSMSGINVITLKNNDINERDIVGPCNESNFHHTIDDSFTSCNQSDIDQRHIEEDGLCDSYIKAAENLIKSQLVENNIINNNKTSVKELNLPNIFNARNEYQKVGKEMIHVVPVDDLDSSDMSESNMGCCVTPMDYDIDNEDMSFLLDAAISVYSDDSVDTESNFNQHIETSIEYLDNTQSSTQFDTTKSNNSESNNIGPESTNKKRLETIKTGLNKDPSRAINRYRTHSEFDEHSTTQVKLSNESHYLLLSKKVSGWRAVARLMKSAEDNLTFIEDNDKPLFIIPYNYSGWFYERDDLVTRDPQLQPLTLLSKILAFMPYRFLTLSHLQCFKKQKHTTTSTQVYEKGSIYAGELITVKSFHEDIVRYVSKKFGTKDKIKRILKCTSPSGDCFLLPVEQSGVFYIVKTGKKSVRYGHDLYGSCLYSILDLLREPWLHTGLVQLVYGNLPKHQHITVGAEVVLRLVGIVDVDTVVASKVCETPSVMEVPLDCGKLVYRAVNLKDHMDNVHIRAAVDVTIGSEEYAREMKSKQTYSFSTCQF